MGHVELGVQIQKSIVDINVRVKGPEHHDTLDQMLMLSTYYLRANQRKEAMELNERIFSSMKRLKRIREFSIQITAKMLAEGYLELDQPTKSLEMFMWLTEICLSLAPPESPHTLHFLRDASYGFFSLGAKEKAKSLTASILLRVEIVSGRSINGLECGCTYLIFMRSGVRLTLRLTRTTQCRSLWTCTSALPP